MTMTGLRAYDYLTGLGLVVARLKEHGAVTKLDSREIGQVDAVIEASADLGLAPAQAEAAMRDIADEIIRDRSRRAEVST